MKPYGAERGWSRKMLKNWFYGERSDKVCRRAKKKAARQKYKLLIKKIILV